MAKRKKPQRKPIRTITGGKPQHGLRTYDGFGLFPIVVYVDVDE